MLYINKQVIDEVCDHKELVSIIEKTMGLYETGNFTQPDRITVNRGDKETYLYMPCFTDEVKGTKILTLYADNAPKGIPTIQGLMLLNDPETGKIKAIIEGSTLTAYRTGAVGSCGIKHTTPSDVSKLGIIGSGIQGFYQSIYACQLRDIKEISVFDIFSDKAQDFKERLQKELPNVIITVRDSVEELLENSEVIITVTTSPKPVLPNNPDLLRGKHFIGIGSYKPTMQEFPQALFELLDEVYIDVDFAKHETGDLINPLREGWIKEEQVTTLGKCLNKELNVKNTTLYKSVGMALFDIEVGEYIYNQAIKANKGICLE
ncbi:MAG: ornithine cyclodeaminase family protein [Erysipelotrichaceae bacterium]